MLWVINWHFLEGCFDTDNGKTDRAAGGCVWYETNTDSCGFFDDTDFKANQMCCACKGNISFICTT